MQRPFFVNAKNVRSKYNITLVISNLTQAINHSLSITKVS